MSKSNVCERPCEWELAWHVLWWTVGAIMSDWDTISKIRARLTERNHLLYTGHAVDQRASAARERQVFHQKPHERASPALYSCTVYRVICGPCSSTREHRLHTTLTFERRASRISLVLAYGNWSLPPSALPVHPGRWWVVWWSKKRPAGQVKIQ